MQRYYVTVHLTQQPGTSETDARSRLRQRLEAAGIAQEHISISAIEPVAPTWQSLMSDALEQATGDEAMLDILRRLDIAILRAT